MKKKSRNNNEKKIREIKEIIIEIRRNPQAMEQVKKIALAC